MSEQEGEDVISEAESETSEPIEGTDGEGDAGNGTSTE
jgi:hypothetical protein